MVFAAVMEESLTSVVGVVTHAQGKAVKSLPFWEIESTAGTPEVTLYTLTEEPVTQDLLQMTPEVE